MIAAEPIDITRIVALTEAMLACAHAGDWDGLAALESQQRSLLELVLPNAVCLADREDMRTLLTMHQLVIKLAESARAALREELEHLDKGRKAQAAYTSSNQSAPR